MPGPFDLRGSGSPGSTVEAMVDGQSAGTTTVADDGSWLLSTHFAEPGEYEVGLRALDENDEVVATAEPVVVAVVAAAEAGTFEVAAPTLDLTNGDTLPAGEITLSGTGQPTFPLQILFNGEIDGTATVSDDGQWAYTTQLTEPGDYAVQVLSLDPNGQILAALVPIMITIVPAEATVDENQPQPTIDLPAAETYAPGPLAFSGSGVPGSQVELLVNGEVVGTVTVDENGQWALSTEITEAGNYELGVRIVDEVGNETSASPLTTIAVTDPEAEPSTVDAAILPTLDPIESENLTPGQMALSGTRQPGGEVGILLDDVIVGMVTVDENGLWQFATQIDEPGEYQLSVQAVDQ
jgi:hypothetical protein